MRFQEAMFVINTSSATLQLSIVSNSWCYLATATWSTYIYISTQHRIAKRESSNADNLLSSVDSWVDSGPTTLGLPGPRLYQVPFKVPLLLLATRFTLLAQPNMRFCMEPKKSLVNLVLECSWEHEKKCTTFLWILYIFFSYHLTMIFIKF